MGISNQTIKEYFQKNHVKYDIFIDQINNFHSLNIKEYDFIVKSSGIKFNTKLLNLAQFYKIPVISDLELYYLLNHKKKLIVITGTNGKTTTVTLVGKMMNQKTFGNIGNPIFNCNKNTPIIEASSFMLHHANQLKPHIFAITNIVPHHLDYHQNFDNYFNDKTKIINNMDYNDYLICNQNMKEKLIKLYHPKCKIITFSTDEKISNATIDNEILIYDDFNLKIKELEKKEKHNLENMMIALIIAKINHIDNEIIKNVLYDFKGLEFRMEKIIDKKNLVVYNDSKSTSPESLYVAIKSIENDYQDYFKILILGGKVVDNDYLKVNQYLDYFDKILIFGKFAEEIKSLIFHQNIATYLKLEDLLEDLFMKIKSKKLILFSPSQPSYDLYKNYQERGKHFNLLINYHNFCK